MIAFLIATLVLIIVAREYGEVRSLVTIDFLISLGFSIDVRSYLF